MSTHTLSVTLNSVDDSSDSDFAVFIGETLMESGMALSVEISDSNGSNLYQDDLDEDGNR